MTTCLCENALRSAIVSAFEAYSGLLWPWWLAHSRNYLPEIKGQWLQRRNPSGSIKSKSEPPYIENIGIQQQVPLCALWALRARQRLPK